MTPRPVLTNLAPPTVASTTQQVEPKTRGANRSTKVAGKLKVLPDQPAAPAPSPTPKPGKPESAVPEVEEGPSTTGETDEGDDEEEEEIDEEEEEEYTEVRLRQISQIPQGTARRDALRLTKKKAKSLPRVTAYATSNSYRLNELIKFFHARRQAYHTNPKTIDDEVVYTPYAYEISTSPDLQVHAKRSNFHTGDLLGVPELNPLLSADHDGNGDLKKRKRSKFYTTPTEAEVFVFSYGTVVIWGMTEAQERRFLSSIRRFEVDRLAPEDIEMEDLNYYYANYSRVLDTFVSIRTKLSLSHALSQSVKISLFEALISSKIEETKDIPETLSETGKIGMPHKEIMRKTGELFILRTNINSVGSVLDSPVLQDMLQLLKESSSSRHAERLEQIVIALIGIEIVLGIITILVDLMA
ncbi:hypothetical protein ID866_8815 [Astraeus odoratus]|nr:hypothetical protein ID866_8815 [Astraeus odoratus]